MIIKINLLALTIAGIIWYKFLKKPESPLFSFLKEKIPQIKDLQSDISQDILLEFIKILGLYFSIHTIIKKRK